MAPPRVHLSTIFHKAGVALACKAPLYPWLPMACILGFKWLWGSYVNRPPHAVVHSRYVSFTTREKVIVHRSNTRYCVYLKFSKFSLAAIAIAIGSCNVVVIMRDFESRNPGSNPGRTFFSLPGGPCSGFDDRLPTRASAGTAPVLKSHGQSQSHRGRLGCGGGARGAGWAQGVGCW